MGAGGGAAAADSVRQVSVDALSLGHGRRQRRRHPDGPPFPELVLVVDAAVALLERRRETPGLVRVAQPHAHDMARVHIVVAEVVARVEEGMVVDEDHVARPEVQNQLAVPGDALDLLEGLVLQA